MCDHGGRCACQKARTIKLVGSDRYDLHKHDGFIDHENKNKGENNSLEEGKS